MRGWVPGAPLKKENRQARVCSEKRGAGFDLAILPGRDGLKEKGKKKRKNHGSRRRSGPHLNQRYSLRGEEKRKDNAFHSGGPSTKERGGKGHGDISALMKTSAGKKEKEKEERRRAHLLRGGQKKKRKKRASSRVPHIYFRGERKEATRPSRTTAKGKKGEVLSSIHKFRSREGGGGEKKGSTPDLPANQRLKGKKEKKDVTRTIRILPSHSSTYISL